MATILGPRVHASEREYKTLLSAKDECTTRYMSPSENDKPRAFMAASPSPARNVVGVGIGEKLTDGKSTGVLAITFYVRVKYASQQIPEEAKLPASISGLPTDVVQSGRFRSYSRKKAAVAQDAVVGGPAANAARFRPAQPGCSIGFRFPDDLHEMAGTFGALVTANNRLFVLSNNHVLANESRLPIGTPVYQPGLLDSGEIAFDQIAILHQFSPLVIGAPNMVDCAIAEVQSPALVSNEILEIGAPSGTTMAAHDMIVHKYGRTTGYTVGRVSSVATDVTLQYDTANYLFKNQIIIVSQDGSRFSDEGDSGSLIVERTSQSAIGLLIGGAIDYTVANHIGDVLSTLNVGLT